MTGTLLAEADVHEGRVRTPLSPRSGAGAYRPAVRLVGRPAPADGHRRCPGIARCDESVVAARAAAVRRRRLLLGGVATALIVALALPWGGAGTHTLAAPGPAQAGATVLHAGPYVVRPGDTLWSIAEGLDPSGDPRPVVAELSAEIGGDSVVPGERLELP
jgi:hypothetical protein